MLACFCLQLRTETIDIDDRMIGGNASAEGGGDEGADASSVSGVDVVMNHKLQPSPMKKSDYATYIKGYMKEWVPGLNSSYKSVTLPRT